MVAVWSSGLSAEVGLLGFILFWGCRGWVFQNGAEVVGVLGLESRAFPSLLTPNS